jgi:beta-glucosidase
MKKQSLWLFLLCAFLLQAQTQPPQYKNTKLPINARVRDLLSRMKVEEKVAQMLCHWESAEPTKILDKNGDLDEAALAKRAPNGFV